MTETTFEQNQARAELINLHPHYQAGEAARQKVHNKIFTATAGPFGIGKTTITNEAIRIAPQIESILTTTTRGRKHGEDPAGFKTADEGITFGSMLKAVKNQELINFSPIPGGHVYGTYPEDFPSKYTIGPFLPTSMEHITKAGFEQYNFVYIVAAGELWKNYVLTTRKNLPTQIYKSRIKEAKSSIEFALENPRLFSFIENIDGPDGLTRAAQEVSRIALGQSADTLPRKVAKERFKQMYAVVKELK